MKLELDREDVYIIDPLIQGYSKDYDKRRLTENIDNIKEQLKNTNYYLW